MKSHPLIVFSFLLMASGCAKNLYELEMRLVSDGKVIANPRVIVLEGNKASITEETSDKKTQIDVVAKEVKNSLTLDVNVRTTDSKESGHQHQNDRVLNISMNIAEDKKAEINFHGSQVNQNHLVDTFEVTARKKQKKSLSTAGNTTFRKLVDLK